MENTKFSYLKTVWKHSFPDEPVEIFSEIAPDRREVRVVEFYAGGKMGCASLGSELGPTQLSEKPIPEVAEIAADPQFMPTEITKDEFEEAWAKATRL